MTTTNSDGYEIQIYNRFFGWMTETKDYPTMEVARKKLAAIPLDGFTRRAYETLKGIENERINTPVRAP